MRGPRRVRAPLMVASVAAWVGSAALGRDEGQTPPVADAAVREGTGRIAKALAALPAEADGEALDTASPLLTLETFQGHTGDADGARATLRLAQDSTRRIENPCVRINQLALVARAWAKAGDADTARALARKADDQLHAAEGLSATNRANNLMMIASVYEALDDEREVREVLKRMRAVVAEAPAAERQAAFSQLLMTTVSTGHLDAALGLALLPPFDLSAPQAPGIRVPDSPTPELTAIVQSLRPEDGADGADLLRRIQPLLPEIEGAAPNTGRTDTQFLRTAIANLKVKLGDIAGALEMIDSFHSEAMKARALVRVARAQVESGDRDGARATLQEAFGRADRQERGLDLRSWLAAADVQLQLGDVEGAVSSAERATQTGVVVTNEVGTYAIRLVTRAARERARAGDAEGAAKFRNLARELVEKRRAQPVARPEPARLPPEFREEYGRADMASNEAELGNIDEALRWASTLKDDSAVKGTALRFIAQAQGEIGDIADALRWIEKEAKPTFRREALDGLVSGLVERAGGQAVLSKR